MPLTPQDIQNKRFTVVGLRRGGYDEDEVDRFLDEIEEELRRLLAENASLRQTAATAAHAPGQSPMATPPPPAPAAPPPPAPEPVRPPAQADESDAALKTLMMAQKTAEEAIAQANAEAESILHSARLKAQALEHEAQAAHANRLASLEDDRKDLEAEIAALRGFEREFRTRLRAYLESSLTDLNARPSVEPKAAPRPSAGAAPGAPAPTGPPSAPPAFGAGPPPETSAAPPAAPARPPAPAPAAVPPELAPPASAAGPSSGSPQPPAAPQPPHAAPQPPHAAPQPPQAAAGPAEEGRSALAAAAAAAASLSRPGEEPAGDGDTPTTELPRPGVPSVAPPASGGQPGFVSQPVTQGGDDTPSGPPAQA
jgi:DivIVA domain-containing protein